MGKAQLEKIIQDIKSSSYDAIILVEGKRDKEALKKAGIPDYLIMQVSYKDNNQIYEEIIRYEKRKIIALYDNDNTGKKKFSRVKAFFNGMGIQILDYKKRLKNAGITYIEEIDNRLDL